MKVTFTAVFGQCRHTDTVEVDEADLPADPEKRDEALQAMATEMGEERLETWYEIEGEEDE